MVLNSVVGIAGLGASMSAVESGHDLALANKESLVTGGHLVTKAVQKAGVQLLPVDSEHSAIFQCLQDQHSAKSLTKILLTASRGPFFGLKADSCAARQSPTHCVTPTGAWEQRSRLTVRA